LKQTNRTIEEKRDTERERERERISKILFKKKDIKNQILYIISVNFNKFEES